MKRILQPIYGLAAIGFAVATALSPTPAGAKAIFAGKTVRIIVGYAAGGGYDRFARQLGRHINKYLPGKPLVIVQNMPGAGSVTAANFLYNQAPKDGTVFGEFARSLPILAFSGKSDRVHFDPLKFTWVGTASSYKGVAYMMVVRKDTGIQSIEDLQHTNKTLYFASTSQGSDGTDVPLIMRSVLGLNIEPLLGYPGGNTLYLAVDRGEAQGRMCGLSSIKTAHPEWLKKNTPIRFVMQIGHNKRLAGYSNIPTAAELVHSKADKAIVDMMQAPFQMARPFAGPPGIPAKTTKVLRKAFMQTYDDPGYVREAKKLHLVYSPKSGSDVHKIVETLAKIPRSVYDRYSEILAHPKAKIRQVHWQIVSGTITKVKRKGKLEFKIAGKGKKYKTRMRKHYTKVKINGKKASRKKVKAGMSCKIWYEGSGSYAGRMECTR